MEQKGNQAGPSSADPSTQEGLKDTIRTHDEIIDGAKNDQQLRKTQDDDERGPSQGKKIQSDEIK